MKTYFYYILFGQISRRDYNSSLVKILQFNQYKEVVDVLYLKSFRIFSGKEMVQEMYFVLASFVGLFVCFVFDHLLLLSS